MTPVEKAELHRLLVDIQFWSSRIAEHLAGMDERQFSNHAMACDAVCWCLGCIGEAAGTIKRTWPALDSDLELTRAHAMRNRITHGYFSIDLGIVWYAATESIPNIGKAASRMIDAL